MTSEPGQLTSTAMETSPSIQSSSASHSRPDPPPTARTVTGPPSASALPVVVIEARSGWRLFDWQEIVEYRDLLYFLVLRDVTVLYKQTVLGFALAVLNPFFSMVVFTVIFGMLLKVPS